MENMQISPSVNAILTTVRRMPIAEPEQLADQVITIRAEAVHFFCHQRRAKWQD